MKNFFKSLVVGALLLGSVGCSDMFKEDLYDIYNELDNINARIDSLCNAVNTNIASLQTIIDVMQDNDYVDSITPIVEGGETVGYEIVFTQSGSVKIYHGKKGDTGATGHSPVVGVKQAEDGRWYWTIDGEWMVNAEGEKILAEAIDGEDGAPGADGIPGIDGITPKLKVQDNYWYISYDNGTTWERLGKATGEAGADGDSMFQSVNYNEDYVELVLVDGTVLTIPTWASHMLLVDEIAKINNNISALQAAVKALESNDYVQKVTPVKDEEGNVVGYTLQFAFAGDVTIYHGEDGEKGEDGHTPVIGVRQFEGEWYWTIDNEWLLDEKGNKVPTSGEDGAEGAEGQAGITPELKIEDDYWYVTYDKGQTWTKLGKAKGEDGAAGGDGAAGDAFFEDVDTSDEYYIILTLADGTEIKIPTWKAHQALADAVAQLNTNVQSITVIINALKDNDFVTGTTEIIDPQTNEVIGYKLHFSKSGDIEIYHGTSPAAPQIGIKRHDQYGLCWTYNGDYIKDPGTGKPVPLPQDGADAVAPKFKIEDGRWWMSTDGGRSWEDIGQATGDQGVQGNPGVADSFFQSVTEEYAKDENGREVVAYIVMKLTDGSEYRIPTAFVTDELNKRITALENQFLAISTIVGSLQNAEYVKDIVELYEGPALVGFKIIYIKYVVDDNGQLTTKTSEKPIYFKTDGSEGTVVGVMYDNATEAYYWTINGEAVLDKDGNMIPVEHTAPTIEIKDGYLIINGENTGIKAEGEGDDTNGEEEFYFEYKLVGNYYEFYFSEDGEPVRVPTWKAFEDLQRGVSELEATVASLTELLHGNKYVEKVEDTDGGYVIYIKEYIGGEWKSTPYPIYDGVNPEAPQISVSQDPENPEDKNYYWKVGDKWLTDGNGNKIRANGTTGESALTPEFRIINGTLYYKYTNEGDDKWRELANVQGSSAAVNIIFQNPANPLESEWIEIRFGEGENDKIKIPTWVAYEKIQDTISSLTTNVEAISALVYGHKYVESFKELENGGYEFVVRYYDENAKEWKTEVHTIDITTADEIGVKKDETDNNYYWTKGGEWLLDANGEKVKAAAERTLQFKSENDGKLYYKYSDEGENDWKEINIAVSESVVDSNVVVKEEDGKVTVTVFDDAGLVLYTFSAPSWEEFEALQGRVIALEEQVTDIYGLIAQLTTNYEALSGDVKNMAAKLAKCKFIGEYEYDEERKGHIIYLVDIDGNKLQNAAGDYETIFIADGEDGEDFDASMLSFKEVDGDYFWTYNGEILVDAAGKPVKAHGADGRTPEFRISNDVLQYRYEGEGDGAWQSLGNVKGSASAANITVENPADPDHSMWIMIQYTYTDAQGNEIVEEVKLPTYYAYEKALDEIAAIKSTIDMVETFLKGNKFVSDYELTYDNNGMVSGCTVTTAEYKLQEDGSYRVFTSEIPFNPSQIMSVKLENDVWYLVFYNENGEEVKRPLSQSTFTFVPKVAVNNGYLYVAKVSEPGNDYTDTTKWDCLGAVVELLGGETQGALKSVEEVDGYICFTFSNGEVLKVPSDAKFQEVLDRLDEVEGAVETIQNDIVDLTTSLTALETELAQVKENQAKYLTSAEFEEWKFETQFVKSVVKDGEKLTFEVVNGNGEIVKTVEYTVNHPISVTTKENGDLYWVINGKEYPVESKPKFQVDQLSGNLQFSIDGSDWTTLESASNNVVDVVFTNDPAVGPDENLNPADANWVGIYYSEKNIIWMPTYKNFNELVATVTRISEKVAALDKFVTGRSFVKDFNEEKDDEGNVVGFTATLVDYKYDETSKGYVLNTDTEELTFTYKNPVSVIEKDGKYYWHIKTADDYVDILADGASYPKVELYNGRIYVSVDSRSTTAKADIEGGNAAYWALMDITQTEDTDTHATCTEETIGGYLYYVIKMWKEDGTETEIKVPSAAAFTALVERVTILEKTVKGLQTLLSALDFTFVTGITEKKDASGNVIGIDFTTKTVTDGTVTDGTSGSVSFDGLVTPNESGDGFTISGYEKELNWKHDLKFVIENGVIKFSIDGGKTYAEVALPVDNNTFGRTVEIKETIGSSEVVTGYQIYFPDPKDPTKEVGPYEVRKWFTTPVITFGTDGTLDLGTASEKSVTCKITGSFTETPKIYAACEGHYTSTMEEVSKVSNTEYTVKITIKQTTAYAGDNKGGKLTVYCPYYGNTGIGQINLTAASVGRPSIQSTNIEPLTILEKPANDATASITFRLEGEDAPPSNRLPVIIDNNYTLTDVQSVVTNNGTKDVETGSGFGQNLDYEGKAGWIKLGAFEYEATTNEFTQHFTLDNNASTTTPRTGAVVVFSPSGREVARFVIKQEANVVDNTPVINLVETNGNKAANCYIITDPGRYQIDTYMGAYNTDISSRPKCTGKPEVIWNEGGNTITPCQVGFSDNKLIFDVKGTINPGNAIIGIRNPKDANDILWSWHLWFCPKGAPGTQTHPAGSDGQTYDLMDRNLGAVADPKDISLLSSTIRYWSDGLFYQWGRKDPIRLNSNKEANNEDPKNSDVQFDPDWNASDTWTTSKAVTDPCPPGYKVPSSSVWRDDPNEGVMELIAKNTLTAAYPYNVDSGDLGKAILYPYVGYINTNGNFTNGTLSNTSTEGTYTTTNIYAPTSAALPIVKTEKWTPNVVPRQFRNVKHSKTDINIESSLWSSDILDNSLTYGYVSKTTEILGYEYREGTWNETITKLPWFLGGGTTYTYTVNWEDTWHPITSEWDKNTNTYNDKLTEYYRSEILQILDLTEILSSRKLIYDKSSVDVKRANQVRCVQE